MKTKILTYAQETFECKFCRFTGKQDSFKIDKNPSQRKEIYKCPNCKGNSIFVRTVKYKEIKKKGFFHSHTQTETRTVLVPLHEWLHTRNLAQVGKIK